MKYWKLTLLYSSCFEIPEAEHASAASRSGCSRAKPTAHTGFGIPLLFCVILIGCSRNVPRPSDLPALNPCKITITQGNNPLNEADVEVVANDPTTKYRTASGVTNNSGIANLLTYGFSGVPVGTYKVLVKKTVLEGASEQTDESGVKQVSGGKDYNLVNKKYQNENTTDLEIKIKNGQNEFSFDVGEPVHNLLESTPL
ncbi:MAG: carboxypeptidase-like regulatory domain-containing protein [Planctomycetaceae bacterium]|jgi:hypothetical protein|nr:carboxypeptidase-like regulatory domain-containing protein [Planctomycetaceae bacterium]